MKIGFIGAGNMSVGLGKHWAAKGHSLFFSHSRDREKLQQQAASVSSAAKIGTATEAAAFADVLVLATPWAASPSAIEAAGDLSGKILWSIVNPLKPDFSGLEIGTTTSGAKILANLAAGANFVAALPPFAEALQSAALPTPPPSVFICGSDANACAIVGQLVADLGAGPVDAGPLFTARFFEPMMMGLVFLAYSRKMGSGIGLHLSRT